MKYCAIPTKLYKKREAVVRLETGDLGKQMGDELQQSKELDKLVARRGGTLKRKILQLSNIYSIDGCCISVMVLEQEINKGL